MQSELQLVLEPDPSTQVAADFEKKATGEWIVISPFQCL
jgi:hypothetical protein